MKKIKYLFAFVLSFCFAFPIFGCNNSDSNGIKSYKIEKNRYTINYDYEVTLLFENDIIVDDNYYYLVLNDSIFDINNYKQNNSFVELVTATPFIKEGTMHTSTNETIDYYYFASNAKVTNRQITISFVMDTDTLSDTTIYLYTFYEIEDINTDLLNYSFKVKVHS